MNEEKLKKILSKISPDGILKSRESITVEYKESFNKSNIAKYAKTMAAFANNQGGYIIFGVKDKPRKVIGLKNDHFENLNQEQFTEAINTLFAPAMDWCCGTLEIPSSDQTLPSNSLKIGWIYTKEMDHKPVIAQKVNDGEKINNGDVFYRYRARTEKIKFAEMQRIIEQRERAVRDNILKIIELVRKSDTVNLGIVNYANGKMSTPYGVDIAFDRKLVTQVLKKAKFIKEGSFHETQGTPVIKVTGNIDLVEEVPVPEGEPDVTHPYIQKELAQILGVNLYDLRSLVWYYKMKEASKYHLEITTSKTGKIHKFSEFALQFLTEKIKELRQNPAELEAIRKKYTDRTKKN